MAYKFNPFTGNLDEVGTGGGGGTTPPAGSDTQIQFNDGGAFGGDAGLTYNKTTGELTVAGDINLDDGGTFSTTLQSVTPTADRTISFPDATGTVALVSGADGTIQYNDAGTLKGNSDFTVDPDWNDASTVFTGLKLNVTNTASAGNSKLLDLQSGGTSRLFVTNTGAIRLAGQGGGSPRLIYDQYGHGLGGISGGASLMSGGAARIWALGGGAGTTSLYFTASSSSSFSFAAALVYDTDNFTIAQRNGTNAQTYRLYNTYTDASNYERGSLKWDTNVFKIGTENDGTGTARDLTIQTGGTDRVTLGGANGLTIAGNVSQIFADCTTYFASTTAAGSRALAGNGFAVGSAYAYSFSSTTGANGTPDIALTRDSAGVVKVTDGSTGTGYLKLIPTTVGALTPAATVGAGTKAFVTDSTSTLSAHHGQAVVGGGNNFVPVFSDGTNWIVG